MMTERTFKPVGPLAQDPTASQEVQATQVQAPAPRKHKRNALLTRGSLVLLGIYAAGFGALYVLGRSSGPKSAMGEQNTVYAKVDAALNQMDAAPITGDFTRPTDAKAIVDDFYTAAKLRQVERSRLARNPFVFKEREPETQPVAETRQVEPKDTVPTELKAALAAVKTLKLQSVIVGRNPAALVSNNLVNVGQNVKGWTVTRISPGEVELTWKDQKHVLELPR